LATIKILDAVGVGAVIFLVGDTVAILVFELTIT
jgi:hypothetical protein